MLQNNNIEYRNNILIVDDEINVCRGCERIFNEEGYITNYALSGLEGLEKADNEDFDVIITDMKMPDISGMEVIKRLKQKQPDIPVIMITGYASVPTAVEAMKFGADDYIPKPFKPDEILSAVQEAMKRVNENKTANVREEGKTRKSRADEGIIEKEQVLAVLTRARNDMNFWRALIERGSDALKNYALSNDAKAAIVSGDINWIKNNCDWEAGELTEDKLTYIRHRLEMERW